MTAILKFSAAAAEERLPIQRETHQSSFIRDVGIARMRSTPTAITEIALRSNEMQREWPVLYTGENHR